MTTCYIVNKCKYISFVSSEEHTTKQIDLRVDNEHSIVDLNIPLDKEFTLFIDATSNEFNDINILTDKDHKNESSSQLKTQDVLKGPIMGASNNLDAFNEGKYSVQVGKKNASITPCDPRQNHDVLDTIAENGIVVGNGKFNSIKLLFNMLSKAKAFNLIIMHPALDTKILEGNYPDQFIIPKYKITKGEITAVLYRYICLYFFGYCSIKDEENYEKNYEL